MLQMRILNTQFIRFLLLLLLSLSLPLSLLLLFMLQWHNWGTTKRRRKRLKTHEDDKVPEFLHSWGEKFIENFIKHARE